MALSNIQYWILAQVILETLLVVGIVYFLIKIRQIKKDKLEPQEMQNLLQEVHLLKDELFENLQAKKDIIHNLVKTLDLRIETTRELLEILEKRTASPLQSPRRPENYRPQVSGEVLLERLERLHQQGYSVDEIAQQLQVSKGEVMLGLDLARAKSK